MTVKTKLAFELAKTTNQDILKIDNILAKL